MPNASLQAQINRLMVGHDESLETELDMVRSEFGRYVSQVNIGVASGVDFTVASALPSNRIAHVKTLLLANYTAAAECRLDFYDNSVGAVNTMVSFTLQTMGKTGDTLPLTDIKGLMFSTGYIVCRAANSNAMVFAGGILRPKQTFEYQSNLAPMP